MSWTTTWHENAAVIRIGDTPVEMARSQLRHLVAEVMRGRPREVVLDASQLDSCPDWLIGFSITITVQVRMWPGTSVMLVARVPGHVEATELTHRTVPVFDTVEAALAEVGMHPRVPSQVVLTAVPGSCSMARDLVRDAAERWGVDECSDRAAVIVTELVENAVEHTRSKLVTLSVERIGARFVVTVVDDDSRAPVLRESPRDGFLTHSVGLTIVAGFGLAWGCTPMARGKAVWAVC